MAQEQDKETESNDCRLSMNDGIIFFPEKFFVLCKKNVKEFKDAFDCGYYRFLETLQIEFKNYTENNPKSDPRADIKNWLWLSLEHLFDNVPVEDRPATLYATQVCISAFFDVSLFWRTFPLSQNAIDKLSPIMLAYLKAMRFSLNGDVSILINEQELLQQYNNAVEVKDYVTLERLYPRFSIVADQLELAPQQLMITSAKFFLIENNPSMMSDFLDKLAPGLFLKGVLSDISIEKRLELCKYTSNFDFIIHALFGERKKRDVLSQCDNAIFAIVSNIERLMFDSHYKTQVIRQITERVVGSNYEDSIYAFGVYLSNAAPDILTLFLDHIEIQISHRSHFQYRENTYSVIAAGYEKSKIIEPDDLLLTMAFKKWRCFLEICLRDDDLVLTEECMTDIDAFVVIFYRINPLQGKAELHTALDVIRRSRRAICTQWYKSKMHYVTCSYIALYKYAICFRGTFGKASALSELSSSESLSPFSECPDVKDFYDEIKRNF